MRSLRAGLLFLIPLMLAAQGDPLSVLRAYSTEQDADRREGHLLDALDPSRIEHFFRAKDSLAKLESGRSDEDLSGSGRSDGSTALASVAGIADSISVAMETGGFLQSTSGTVSTIRVKPVAIYDAFAHRELLPCRQYLVLVSGAGCGGTADHLFKGFSVAVSLDSSQPNQVEAQPAATVSGSGAATNVNAPNGSVLSFLTQRRALNSWSLRYELLNRRDARDGHYMRAWNDALSSAAVTNAGNALTLAYNAAAQKLDGDAAYTAWKKKAMKEIKAARSEGWDAILAAWEKAVTE